MEKKIEDYLHLYLGCEAERTWYYSSEPNTVHSKRTVIVDGGLIENPIGTSSPNIDLEFDLKPILHPLSDMTEEEGKEYVALGFGGMIDQRGGKLIYQTFTPPCFLWLLSKHFDLFGLIDSGLAIDKTKM